ncbi:MAG: PaaI family thioesterase [Planctomycetota bacterium]|nr:PaaI family thioesterase [Planctomycetota bacterium]
MSLKITKADLIAFLQKEFPQLQDRYCIEELAPYRAVVSQWSKDSDLRPGGTVSGPAMFALADCAFYIATLGMIGPKALTVTTGANMNFMRKPLPGKLIAEARIMKLGRSLSVGDVILHCGDKNAPVAHAALTYSIPPRS